MDNKTEYWDRIWNGRIHDDGSISGNVQKVEIIIKELWNRPWLIKAKKFEIGCGPATHVRHICHNCSEWGENYFGVDTSETAVADAVKHGVNATVASIYDIKDVHDVEAFLIFDVLEHLEDHDKVAKAIKRMAANNFSILMNVPLYKSNPEENGGFERLVDINTINDLIHKAGCNRLEYKVYGINGYPYMFAEGYKK